MRLTPLALAAATAVLRWAAPAHAAPFDARLVTADAKWVLHVDVDAARDSAVGRAVQDKLAADPHYADVVRQCAAAGVRVPQDVHDVTLYDRTPAAEDAPIFVVHATVDRAKLTAKLRGEPGTAAHPYKAYDILAFGNDQRTLLAFHDDATVVVAQTEANLTAALDALDGTAAMPAAGGPLTTAAVTPATRPAVAAGDRPLVFFALADLAGLMPVGAAVPGPFKQLSAACVTVTEAGPAVLVRANLTAATPAAADQLRRTADGLRAVLALSADGGPDADPKMAIAKALVRQVALGQADRTVTADLSVPVEQVRHAIDAAKLTVDDKAGRPASTGVSVGVNVAGPTTRPAAAAAAAAAVGH